jgi:hypothetical protein
MLLAFAGYCFLHGYPIQGGYFFQQIAEMTWPQAEFDGGFFTEAAASINSEFTAEEDLKILKLAGNIDEWWMDPQHGDFIVTRDTLEEMFENYSSNVGDYFPLR